MNIDKNYNDKELRLTVEGRIDTITSKELEEEILHADTISLKGQGSFDGMLLKEIRKELLWKTKKRRK